MPIILLGISLSAFFVFTNPLYNEIKEGRSEVASYNEALSNAKALENERDKLTAKFNSINPDNLTKLQKLLPGSIDNIRLILEIEQIALPYGMTLKDVKYNATPETKTGTSAGAGAMATPLGGGVVAPLSNKDYGIWDLEFSTTGTYNNFLNFTRDLESNLRIVDVASIEFSSDSSGSSSGSTASPAQSYTYHFKIKTYWLKN
jgi:Tfp pilus assembly protein PilO